ncbi:MAG: efflux RND transporter periplasmic adaptor subunit [Bacteroidota bacterium]|nr:efflux RND transporter periplasmic adaptor subunit [Bacteroidota bacterium]MDP4206591.1 efflux RND transporter periplasmic adaptor subunit [Bacteroidota bacterium]
MNSAKKILLSIVLLILIGGTAIMLANTKKSLEEKSNMSEIKADFIPVKVTYLNNERVNDQIIATGNLEADKNLLLLSESQGKVVRIYKENGDYVQKGQAIVKVDDEIIRSSVLVAEANYDQAKKDLERYISLNKGEAISKHQVEQARVALKKAKADLITARKQQQNTIIQAPISGNIANDDIEIGTLLSGGMKICEIIDISKLKLIVKVPENDVLRLNKGESVSIKLSALPAEKFSGTIKSIGVKADAALRYDVEITIHNNPGQKLKAGLYAEAIFSPKEKVNSCLLDRKAIIGSLQSPTVYAIENNIAHEKSVIVGRTINDKVEILEGITNKDAIVFSGQINLKEGSKVKIIQ